MTGLRCRIDRLERLYAAHGGETEPIEPSRELVAWAEQRKIRRSYPMARPGESRGGGVGRSDYSMARRHHGDDVMPAGLKSRIQRLEGRLGGGDTPRKPIIVMHGPGYTAHRIERRFGQLHFQVPCPRDDEPSDHFSAQQRALIRAGDTLVIFEAAHNPRDASWRD